MGNNPIGFNPTNQMVNLEKIPMGLNSPKFLHNSFESNGRNSWTCNLQAREELAE